MEPSGKARAAATDNRSGLSGLTSFGGGTVFGAISTGQGDCRCCYILRLGTFRFARKLEKCAKSKSLRRAVGAPH